MAGGAGEDSGGTAGGGGAIGSGSGGGAAGSAQAGVGGSVIPSGGVAGAGGQSGGGARADGGEATSEGGAGGAPPEPQPVELAQGLPATASSEQGGNAIVAGNDGVDTTRWCASAQTFPQWWRVDLGSEHLLTSFSVHWEHGDREYSYLIETSSNDTLFTTRVSNSATGLVQTADFPANTQARYVRITVTGALPAGWASFYELSLSGF